MRRSARVLEDAEAGAAVSVRVDALTACRRCAQGQGCGAAGLFGQRMTPVLLQCSSSVRVHSGDQVQIDFGEDDSSWLWLAAGAYGLPVLGLMLSVVVAGLWLPTLIAAAGLPAMPPDLLQAAAALAGLCGGVFAWRRVAPGVLSRCANRPYLQSGRIVTIEQGQLAGPADRPVNCDTRENL